ncbi:hypothetical protein QQZ08_002598 [Neonectria magnoliae]|uniref:Uncharacterized protein n=1 Tax=Neonectria magnoliae TaxID=2732573 RepID=A0ABR1IB26_9HYPO
MPRLDDFTLLMIADNVDPNTFFILRKVPLFRRLLRRYHKSVVKNIHKTFTLPIGGGNQRFIFGPSLRPSDGCWARQPISADHFASLFVAMRREFEIESILSGGFFGTRPDSAWPLLSDSAHRMKLKGILKEALYRCDAMADLEAVVLAQNFRRVPLRDHDDLQYIPVYSTENMLCAGFSDPRMAEQPIFLPPRHPLQIGRNETRSLQQAYIRSLRDEGLFGLYALCFLSILGRRSRTWHLKINVDTTKDYYFSETMLRHGSWFMYAHIRGYLERSVHRQALVKLATWDA